MVASPVPGIPLNSNGIPTFEQLPLRKNDPPYSAWGLYGDKDELGTLNRLTNSRVAAAAQGEIKTGQRISLNWPLNAQSEKSFFARKLFHQEMFHKQPYTVNDDVWTFNTQVSSQWDGLRHFGYQKEQLFYNGVTMKKYTPLMRMGTRIQRTGFKQGIVGRGVLIDWYGWKMSQPGATAPDHFASTSIALSELQAALAAQGTEIKFGDILFIRSARGDLLAIKHEPHPNIIGVEQTPEIIKWIWESFSAVAGDTLAFECWPPVKEVVLHEILLSGWGCPIGELFDLEKLAEQCKSEGRWSFFVASEPCNVPGGVASPPNILAIL
ncbi:hypothetical protein BKA62DRAFT_708752 [Auriculariales sp. MPI-PUGE-AT-0066]|nr:hypothetical protein BKA62DRAFT_708752 [Auriculariales sp. MPI-PUGE-AT-0066]